MNWPKGTKVRWIATPGIENVTGTIVDSVSDRDGLILVRWSGIGTYKEDPIHLREITAG